MFRFSRWSQECSPGTNIVGAILFLFVIYMSGAKFEKYCSNISGDILNDCFSVLVEPPMMSSLS